MYNILITDDEQIVIESLSFIINKNFEGQVNLFTALSGTEALELITKENIDITFMDINMPGLNGLETISCIKKIKPETVVIILSAFDRFQYAQEAMNLGAFKYMTKPVNRNDVTQTIRLAMDFIDSKRGKVNADLELHKKLDLVSPMIENDFICACIYNNDKSQDVSSYFNYFNLTNTHWCFLCLEIPKITSDNQYSTYLKIREILNNQQHCLVSSFMMNRIVIFLPVLNDISNNTEIHETIKNLYSQLSYNISSGIRLGVSSIQCDKNELAATYKEALISLNNTSELGGISFFGENQTETTNYEKSLSEYKKQIIIRLKQGDSTGVSSFLELYSTDLFKSQTDINKIKNTMFELLVTARNETTLINTDFQSPSFDNAFSFFAQENNNLKIKEFVNNLLMECINSINTSKKQKENPTIKKICDYIQDHMSEDISLDTISEHTGMSTFYLSKLFKEEKGITFINFITNLRLDEAQKLLKETDLSIKEITAHVGYNDQNYFSRIFRNKFGISPSEFRNV